MVQTVAYTGAPDTVCIITGKPLSEIETPVAFHGIPYQPYECEAILDWMWIYDKEPLQNRRTVWLRDACEILAPIEGLCSDPDAAVKMIVRRTRWRSMFAYRGLLTLYLVAMIVITGLSSTPWLSAPGFITATTLYAMTTYMPCHGLFEKGVALVQMATQLLLLKLQVPLAYHTAVAWTIFLRSLTSLLLKDYLYTRRDLRSFDECLPRAFYYFSIMLTLGTPAAIS